MPFNQLDMFWYQKCKHSFDCDRSFKQALYGNTNLSEYKIYFDSLHSDDCLCYK